MHQSGSCRDRMTRYRWQLARLREIADVTQMDVAVLTALLHRMRVVNQAKEVLQAQPHNRSMRD
jgi:hypothetical protein